MATNKKAAEAEELRKKKLAEEEDEDESDDDEDEESSDDEESSEDEDSSDDEESEDEEEAPAASKKDAPKKDAPKAAKSNDEDEDEDEDEEDEDEPKAAAKSALKANVQAPLELGALYSLRNIWTLTRREFRSYFDSLVAYVVVGVSALLLGLYFFFYHGGFWQVDRATMGPLFDVMPFAICVMTPLVTMGSLAEEKRSGTIELLITMPVKDSEVILAKFFAALGMCIILLLGSIVIPFAMFVFPWHMGALDWGPVWTGYFGLILMSSAGVAIGLLFSSITESQIIAFFASVLTMLVLYMIGFVVEFWHGVGGDIIGFVSLQTRFLPFARGLIDTRAVVYFVSIAVISLVAAFRSLESRKWS